MANRSRASVAERLERLSVPEPNSGCVLWLGYIDPQGYGRFTVSKERTGKLAHVVAYELAVGPVPAGMELDHLCRNTACIAPWHLEPVTHRENLLRGIGPAAVNAAKTACIHGHSFDDANTYHDRRGWRSCNTCRRASDARRGTHRKTAPVAEGSELVLLEVAG